MQRAARRFLIPFAIVLAAAALGTFVLGRSRVSADSSSLQNPGIRLASSSHQTLAQQIAAGRTLFEQTCSTCHGGDAQGGNIAGGNGTGAPKLQGIGGATVDLWLSAGWMPLKTPEQQPEVKAVIFSRQQILDIVAFVESTAPTLPGKYDIPVVDLSDANVAAGFDIFSLNCAPCHTITGSGDALAYGVHAPSLHDVTPLMVLEAIRTGPQNMPPFGPNDISNKQAQDVVAFVTKDIQHPSNIGGLGLGGVGPVAEGFVGLFVGVGVCLVAAYWVGDRTDPDAYGEGDEHGHEGHDGHGDDEAAEATDESSDEGAGAEDTES
ncbi:MAG TPA: c-type cytochrome [Acidimicrobiales bacterium]|jgi:ubiquinol-cytochrome c reductase cytochrome c subunit|nr:c-type cytochrome [Acidimicrobiales bacterium]